MPATRRTSEYLPVADLLLDPDNFRLPDELGLEDQIPLCEFIEARYDLAELANSMIRDGFRPEEPLIAVQENDGLVVVEGNRRLSTLKLLQFEEFRNGLPTTKREVWTQFARDAEEAGHDLAEVPVVLYGERSEVEGSLGFRHVSGIAPWSAESKARYISHLVAKGHSFAEVARMIGSRGDYVRRQHAAHAALSEAAAADVDVSRAERHFGVYYRALSSPPAREFVGLDWAQVGSDSPVLTKGPEALGEFVGFLFGTENAAPVLTDSRRVDDLGRVLGDEPALAVLREERSLDAAIDVLGGDRSAISAQLRGALARLRQANGAAFEFVGDEELIDLAEKCVGTAHRLLDQLQSAEAPEE